MEDNAKLIHAIREWKRDYLLTPEHESILDAALDAFAKPKKPKWIAVSKTRPPIGQTVLTWSKHHGIKIRTYRKAMFSNEYGELAEWTCYSYAPKYWMPLPKSPEKETDESRRTD